MAPRVDRVRVTVPVAVLLRRDKGDLGEKQFDTRILDRVRSAHGDDASADSAVYLGR